MAFIPMLVIVGILFVVAVALAWWLFEKRRRTTHPVQPGYQADIEFPHDEPFELYHNALSLCSMKTRVCLSELQIPYRGHHIDLIETGRYDNIRPRLLEVNPGGTVPVLLHEGGTRSMNPTSRSGTPRVSHPSVCRRSFQTTLWNVRKWRNGSIARLSRTTPSRMGPGARGMPYPA